MILLHCMSEEIPERKLNVSVRLGIWLETVIGYKDRLGRYKMSANFFSTQDKRRKKEERTYHTFYV